MEISWPGEYGEIHTRILQRMREVLREDTQYPYLKPNALHRLNMARRVARNTGMTERSMIHLGGFTWCMFPWLGTRSFRTLRKMVGKIAPAFGISGMDYEGCNYMMFRMERGNERDLFDRLTWEFSENRVSPLALVSPKELPIFEKYDRFVPAELLRHAYAEDRLDMMEAIDRIHDIQKEYDV